MDPNIPENIPDNTSGDLFLSYHRTDSEAVLAVQKLLRARGISTFLDRDQLMAGMPWPQALEQALHQSRAVAVFIGPGGLGLWQKRELGYALDRQVQEEREGQHFPVIPVILPGADITAGFLFLNTWIDLRTDRSDPEALNALARTVEGSIAGTRPEELEPLCPYRGLRPFREEDAAFFYGREAFSLRLLEAILSRNLVTVVGTSGSGKSSIVQAGVIPLLRRRHPPENTWDTVSFVPGTRPFHHLAASLILLLEPDIDETGRLLEAQKLGDLLARKEVTIESTVERVLRKSEGTDRLLLVADQFEELFTQTSEPGRQAFLEALLQALDNSPLTVVLTVRGSFYDSLISSSRDLSDRLEQAVINLGTMTRDELQRAVIEPAKRVGLNFEPGLVKRILDDVGDDPGNLPLLEFALTELWARRQGKLLTHAAYEESGEVSGAMAQRAEVVFATLSPTQQEGVHRLLTRLVWVGDQAELTLATRQRAPVSELGEKSRQVLMVMTDARLLVIGKLGAGGEETAEVAHEALIRHWERLRGWLDEDREFLLWRRRLQTALAEWGRTNREEGALLRGTPLREAERWISERLEDLSPLEQEFINNSSAQDKREQTLREHRRKTILIASLGSTIVFLLLTSFALIQSLEASSRELAATARSQLLLDPESSLLIAIEAVNIKQTDDAVDILRQSLMESHLRIRIKGKDIVTNASFSPDGTRVVLGSDDNTAQLWNISGGKPLLLLELKGHTAGVTCVKFSPDGSLIATSSVDKTIRLWDAITGQSRAELLGHTDTVNCVSFSPDGKFVVSASDDRTARVWDTKTSRLDRILHGHTAQVTDAAYSPDGNMIVTSSADRSAKVWSPTTGGEIATLRGHRAPLAGAIFSPAGNMIVTASDDNTARVWTMQKGKWGYVRELAGHVDSLTSVAFSPGGDLLVTSSLDRTARVWDTQSWLTLSELRGHTDVLTHAEFSPDGSRIITSSRDTTARIWESLNEHARQALRGHAGTVESAELSHDAKLVATASTDNTARLWDTATGKSLHELSGHTNSLTSVAISPDGKFVVTASDDHTARIWDAGTGKSLHLLEGHTDSVRMATFSPDGALVVTAGNDATARVWDAQTGKPVNILGATGNEAQSLPNEFTRYNSTFSPDGSLMALVNPDNAVMVWNIKSGNQIAELKEDKMTVTGAVFSPNAKLLVTTSADATARIWDLVSGKSLHELQGHDDRVTDAAFSPDGTLVVTGSADHTARIWDVSSGKLRSEPLKQEAAVTGVAFINGGKAVVATLDDTSANVWDVSSGQLLRRMHGDQQGTKNRHSERIYSAQFSLDGRLIVTASADSTARIWSARSGQSLVVLKGHTKGVTGASFSPDGSVIVTASKDGTANLWEAKSGKLLHRLQGHADEVTSANFSADGKWIITSSKDSTARVWDASTGRQLTVLTGHRDWVNRAEFSPDSRLALTASRDKTTLVWQRYGETEWRVKARLFGHSLSVVRARFSSGSKSIVTASRDGTARVWRLNETLSPSPGLTPTKSSPVEACDVCWPSSEEIYTLAANRIRHADSRLDPVEHFHDTRYKIIRWFIPKRIE